MTRKIIQIATAMTSFALCENADNSGFCQSTMALCNDGSLWEWISNNDRAEKDRWEKIPLIPQQDQEISINNLK